MNGGRYLFVVSIPKYLALNVAMAAVTFILIFGLTFLIALVRRTN